MNNKLIQVDELDFDQIKSNIRTFLQGQTELTDYNFEGSVISTLIDLLAYNTHFNALYTNLALNESFIDSASKYSSVVSLAKSIGYTAKSAKSAKATLTVVCSNVPGNPAYLTMPKGVAFKTEVDGLLYTFYTSQPHTVANVANAYTFVIEVVEGAPISNSYTVGTGSEFVIPNKNIDLSTVIVSVQENASSSTLVRFNSVDDLLAVKGVDTVYFVKQREDLLYEIYFGNDVIGKAVSSGNVVFIDYLISNGNIANGCEEFFYGSGFRADINYAVSTTIASHGGANVESIDSIKFNAPRAYVSQNRAVTVDDYTNQILTNFPQVESVSVWGGQDHEPKQYGRVFISAKPFGRDALNSQEKLDIQSFLSKRRAVVSIQQMFIDPTILNIGLTTNVYFNQTQTSLSQGDIYSLVETTVNDYSSTLNTFDAAFRYSKLSRMIDTVDSSIISNITTMFLQYTIAPLYGIAETYVINIGNPIQADNRTIKSSRFYIPSVSNFVYLTNTSSGNIDLINQFADGSETYRDTVGSVDFNTGRIVLNSLLIASLYDFPMTLKIIPKSNDVIPTKQSILVISPELTTINIIPDSQNHIFTSSR